MERDTTTFDLSNGDDPSKFDQERNVSRHIRQFVLRFK